jgi:hypothetical protein
MNLGVAVPEAPVGAPRAFASPNISHSNDQQLLMVVVSPDDPVLALAPTPAVVPGAPVLQASLQRVHNGTRHSGQHSGNPQQHLLAIEAKGLEGCHSARTLALT